MAVGNSLRTININPPTLLLKLLALLCFLFCAYIAIRYAHQPLLDLHAFRQTQTALSSYWFGHDGFRLDYETPVGGYPWSIPFEFPIYQYLVTAIVKVTGARLDFVGRLLSFLFLAACLLPARSVIRKLQLPNAVFFAFAALLFSSPVYLYWGRTFMIESAAVFFAAASLPFFLDVIASGKVRSILWFGVFSTLAMLQKVTTELPLLALLAAAYAWSTLRASTSWRELFKPRTLATAFACFAIPAAIGALWTIHSDQVKELNPLGAQLTSGALGAWNWGTLAQRSSRELFVGVIWERIFAQNLGGWLGLFAFAAALLCLPKAQSREKRLVLFCLLAGISPLFIFTNLHLIHTYYQTANVIFLLFGLAVIAGACAELSLHGARTALLGVGAVVAANLVAFDQVYFDSVTAKYDTFNSRDIAIGDILKREIPATQSFVAYGNDWSSTLAYFAQRKSFTVAPFFRRYEETVQYPENFIGDTPLGAVVGCLVDEDPYFLPMLRSSFAKGWSFANVYGCYIGLPDRPPSLQSTPRANNACEGRIDFVGALLDPKSKKPLDHILHIWGWTAVSVSSGQAPQEIYISLTDASNTTITRHAPRVPRSDVAAFYHRKKMDDSGFSLIMDTSKLAGKYKIGVIRQVDGVLERCQWQSEFVVE